jgi:hypothetical protein
LIKVAGFEWSSDCYINTVLPEEAAKALGRHIPTGLSEKSLSQTATA